MLNDGYLAIGAVVGIVGLVVAIMGFVSVQSKNLREAIANGDKASVAEAEKLTQNEGKLRHAAFNALQPMLSRTELDIEGLKREAVRREDMNQLDQRWNTTFSRFEVKVDRMSEQMSHLATLEVAVKNCVERLSEVVKRLDNQRGDRST